MKKKIVLDRDMLSSWSSSSVVEQMPLKGMVVSSSLTRPVGFPTAWPLCRQRRKLNTYIQHNMGKLTYY